VTDSIRPPLSQPLTPALGATPAVSPQARAQALAAQKAFFQAALGKAAALPQAAAAVPAAAPARPATAAAVAKPAAAASDSQPVRYLRPGSRLDITV
jgi:hypothetical protein